MGVSVLTPTIPGRESSLYLAARSVGIQSHTVDAHIIVTRSPSGPSPVHQAESLNIALQSVASDWVAVLDDDNWWLPDHLAVLLSRSDGADVVYSWDRDKVIPRVNCNTWEHSTLVERLNAGNFIDGGSAIIRTDRLREVGGFPTEWEGGLLCDGGHYTGSPANFADWELWRRLASVGGAFRCVPAATWVYTESVAGRMSDGFN